MIIVKLEYKFSENAEYNNIPIRQNSGFLSETSSKTRAGTIFLAEVSAYIPNMDDSKTGIVDTLNHNPAIYRVRDASGHYHTIGNDQEKALFTSVKKIGPNPGVAFGWDIKITCPTVAGSVISEIPSFNS